MTNNLSLLAPHADLIRVGNVVGIDSKKYPGRWTIVKINPTTIKLEGPAGVKLTAYPEHIIPAPAESEVAAVRPLLVPGQIVRWASAKAEGHLYVVLADNRGRDVVRIVRRGGGGAWKIPAGRNLTVVDPAEVLKH